MRRTVVNAKGQVTIPAELRKQLEIKPGTRVTWLEEKGMLVLAPITARERRREDLKASQYDPEFKRKTAKAEKIMSRYRNTLRDLAK